MTAESLAQRARDLLEAELREHDLEPYVIAVIVSVDVEPDNPTGPLDNSISATGTGPAIVEALSRALSVAAEHTGGSVTILKGTVGGSG